MQTHTFTSGNSLAVRIPKSLDFAKPGEPIEIRKVGNTLVLKPLRGDSLANVPDLFAAFPKDFMAEGRASQAQKPRARLKIGR